MVEINTDLTPMCKAISNMAKVPMGKFDGIGWGKVTGINPTKIEIEGHEVPPEFIEVSPLCEEWTTEILFKHTHKYDDTNDGEGASGDKLNQDTSEELKKVTLWRGLQVGDEVCVMRTNGSQKFVIMWRKQMWKES